MESDSNKLFSRKRAVIDDLFRKLVLASGKPENMIYYFNNTQVKQVSGIKNFSNQFDATKYDSSEKLPSIMREYGAYILHLGTRDGKSGTHAFIIGKKGIPFEGNYPGYHKLEDIQNWDDIKVKKDILSGLGISEAQTASNLYNYQLIHNFLGLQSDQRLLIQTGRRSKHSYDVKVPTAEAKIRIHAEKVQIEIDVFYEYDNTVAHVEIKNANYQDFAIYQLFASRHYLESNIQRMKSDGYLAEVPRIRSIFAVGMPKQNEYRLYEYVFDNLNELESLRFVKSQGFKVRYE
jgi:hypothetical protein